jgi:hypothetical protein
MTLLEHGSHLSPTKPGVYEQKPAKKNPIYFQFPTILFGQPMGTEQLILRT